MTKALWSSALLPIAESYISPGGVSHIRELIAYGTGVSMVHAMVAPGKVSNPGRISGAEEHFYIVSGLGEIWREADDRRITPLAPGVSVTIPSDTAFQYRSSPDEWLTFLVSDVPRWQRERWHSAQDGVWTPGDHSDELSVGATSDTRKLTAILRYNADYVAPDGSEIRLLTQSDQMSIAHCTLGSGRTTNPVRHKTVTEVWFTLGGLGELWRRSGDDEEVTPLQYGAQVDIPTGAEFQFRSTGTEPLTMLLLTTPPWPGSHEAEPASRQRW